MKQLLFLSALALLLCGAAFAQTPDGQTPPNEGVCDLLRSGTPGLYGLCVAFCESNDCVPDFSAPDPFADCKPSDPKLLELYNEKRGRYDPPMPCISETGCPCWTFDEIAGLRYQSDDPSEEVGAGLDTALTAPFTQEIIAYWSFWRIASAPPSGDYTYEALLHTSEEVQDPLHWCFLRDLCTGLEEGNCLNVSRYMQISLTECYTCKEQLYRAGFVRGIRF